MNRYERYYTSGDWTRLPWQPADRKVFPYVWIVGASSDKKYNVGKRPFRVFQASIDEMFAMIQKK